MNKLPSNLRMGSVHLTIKNMARSLDFYQTSLGLQVHDHTSNTARLGVGGDDLLVLVENPNAPIARRSTGLYHFALLFPSRLALADALRRLIETQTPIQGGADHLVSEAIYLPDPDNNGIELYRDRPRDQWTFHGSSVNMATDPLDYQGILDELNAAPVDWQGAHAGTVMGHVHLHVSHLQPTLDFYCEVLGFDLMARMGHAAGFVSAGGYHHHLGLNTWQGVGAPPPPAGAIGLRHATIILPNHADLEQLSQRLNTANISFEQRDDGLIVRDPSQNELWFVTEHRT